GAPGDSVQMQFVVPKDAPEVLIRDIAVPILNGKLGTLRVGIREEALRTQVNRTIQVFLIMVGVFLSIGLVGAFAFARFINTPIQEISRIADRLDFDVLRQRSQPRIRIREKLLGMVRMPLRAEDELDVLAEKFNGMISRLEDAYTELQRANASLVQSEKLASVGTLAAGIAHEINNPIAGLQNCIRRIRRNPENMRQNEKYLTMMDEAIGKIERVIKGLLDYTRNEEMDFTELDIREVVEKALLLVAYPLEKHRVTVTREFPSQLPPVQGSFNHLEQVIVNLLLNSIHAIRERRQKDPHCPAKIVLSAGMENNKLRLSIQDTGAGIPPEHLGKIFDPFFTTKPVGEGTGLGLSVCYKIVQAHRGTIRVTSNVNRGTEVIIYLPTPVDPQPGKAAPHREGFLPFGQTRMSGKKP
ncbi:MAG: sensor histidine kinase, partial [Calditrichaeota bacterium]